MSSGETIPCSAELVTIELIGEAAKQLDPDMIRQAAAAVLHYFRNELGRTHVSVGEFSSALEIVLRGLGLKVQSGEPAEPGPRIAESDLRQLAFDSGKGCELLFFPRLREELRRNLGESPQVVHFKGLRGCVKQLVGAKRWSGRCQALNDQIVEYLRQDWSRQEQADSCALLVD